MNENARFFDESVTAALHGNAICSTDCLMPNKNAILQTIFFENRLKNAQGCQQDQEPIPTIDCHGLMLQPAFSTIQSGFSPGSLECTAQSFTNIYAGQSLTRIRIWDITWDNPARVQPPDFANGSFLYNPTNGGTFGGSLFSQFDPRIEPWLLSLTIRSGAFANDSEIADALVQCARSDASSIGDQQNNLNTCRSVYQAAYGSTVVGYGSGDPMITSIPVIPISYDKISSMWGGCQYVYNISNTRSCPLIDDMCKRQGPNGMVGIWKFGLENKNLTDVVAELPGHLCQNFRHDRADAPDTAWIDATEHISPHNTYFSGLATDVTQGQRTTIEPQSYAAYIYRSCALDKYTSTPEYCCANDFADGEGSSIFSPMKSQLPVPDPNLPLARRAPLIGYSYDSTGTPWYKACFDRNGLTCDPTVRDIIGNRCIGLMTQHCAVNPETSSPDSWDVDLTDGSSECSRWLGRLLYGYNHQWINFYIAVQNRGPLPTRAGTQLHTDVLVNLTTNFHKVFTMASIADGSIAASPLAVKMEPVVFDLYLNYDLALYDGGILLGQCSIYTIDDVKNNSLLRRWCGCMLNIETYIDRYPGISTACTPTCNSSEVIQFGAPCQGTLCVIDDVTIDLINSPAGTVSLSQVCQACGQVQASDTSSIRQVCECRTDDIHIIAINSRIGNINMAEVCGLTGNANKKAAGSSASAPTRVAQAVGSVTQTFPYVALALLITIVILAVIAYVISRGIKTGASALWARGLAVAALILAIIILVVIIYVVVMKSLA
jgi:hypothetical protein